MKARAPAPSAFTDGPARAARDVPAGTSWAFKEHRTMAEVMEAERAAVQIQEQQPIENGRLVFVATEGVGRVIGLHHDGCYAVEIRHRTDIVHGSVRATFVLPEPLGAPACHFSLNFGRA